MNSRGPQLSKEFSFYWGQFVSSNGILVNDFLSNLMNLNNTYAQSARTNIDKGFNHENNFVIVVADSFKDVEPGTIIIHSLHAIAGLYCFPAAKSTVRNLLKGIEISKKNNFIPPKSSMVRIFPTNAYLHL